MDNEEYFSVSARLRLNVIALTPQEHLPDATAFSREVPPAFRIASQCSVLDAQAQKELLDISRDSSALERFLLAQNEKINLLLSVMLLQFDNPQYRFDSESFGASGLRFSSKQAFAIGQQLRMTLFLDTPCTAVYCYGNVVSCTKKDEQYHIDVSYSLLQEEDRDVLIRAALYHQQKLLRRRASSRPD